MEKSIKKKHLNPKKLFAENKYKENKIKLPVKNMCYKNDPPAFITVFGSKNSGKSTLIKNLVKKFTKKSLDHIIGPITFTVAKDKRITLFECKDDIHQYIDTSKISDMVIFIINATVGLECETQEYLSLLMSHGLPKVAFVVTHTDKNDDKKLFKEIKKQIYAEICDGLKFFFLGMRNGKYNESEILNMTRFIASMKYRPIEWKCTHPHVVIDKIDNSSGFIYGYVRGSSISKNVNVHIPGIIDTKIDDFEILEDPVPTKTEEKLSSKKVFLYAPMIHYDKVEIQNIIENVPNIEISQVEDIRLFKKSKNKLHNEVKEEEQNEIEEEEEKKSEENESTSQENEIKEDFETLALQVRNRFRKEAKTEKDFVDKFNEKYVENEKDIENQYTKEKNQYEENKIKNKELKIRDVTYPGEYIKITLQNPICKNFDFSEILILGVYLMSETKLEILQGKIKTNKWHGKLLKTNDPLLFSVGWRRFQSVPVYSSKTSGENRMLKYSFKHGFCLINFYGAVVPPGTGFSVYSEKTKFRVLGYGNIMDVTGECNLVKKLKLIGYPNKVMGNTAFIKDMFTSDLEVFKFKNAKIKSASGLKGIVKNSVGKKGDFRGAFEGEMLMSDIIVLKCFVPFPVYKISIPVSNNWKGLRSLREIREEYNIKIEDKFIEEVTDDEIQDEGKKDFELPEKLERKLPLNKRNICVVDERIILPVAPEDKKRLEFEKDVQFKRQKKDAEITKDKEKKKLISQKERKLYINEKTEKLKKAIIKSNAEKKRSRKK